MSRLSKHCTIRAELMTVLKYVVIVAFQIHFGACLLRYIDGVLLMDNCVDKDGDKILKGMHKDTTQKQASAERRDEVPGHLGVTSRTRHSGARGRFLLSADRLGVLLEAGRGGAI